MLLNYLFVCSGFFGLVNFIICVFFFKKNKLINLQLMFLLLFLSLNFTVISLRDIYYPSKSILESTIYNYLFVFNSTFIYLYIKNLENGIKLISKHNSKHFIFLIITILSASYYRITYLKLDLFKIVFILISLCYYFKTFNLLKNRIFTKRVEVKLISTENDITNKWTVIIYILSLLYLIQIILIGDFYDESKFNDIISNCFGAILFNFTLIKVSSSPELLYGYKTRNIVSNKTETSNLKFGNLWIKNPSKIITNSQDYKLFENIKDNLQIYSNKIDTLIFESKILRKSDISIEEISNMLEIPKSHLTFLFKYHCKINYAEYKKSARVYDSFELIKNGFLKTNTLEALSLKVGFSSYNPFYLEFKKISGTTPKLYSKNYI